MRLILWSLLKSSQLHAYVVFSRQQSPAQRVAKQYWQNLRSIEMAVILTPTHVMSDAAIIKALMIAALSGRNAGTTALCEALPP